MKLLSENLEYVSGGAGETPITYAALAGIITTVIVTETVYFFWNHPFNDDFVWFGNIKF